MVIRLDNGGTVTVKGVDGLLALTSDVTGAGTLATQAGGTLTLANNADIANVLTNAGTTTILSGTSTIAGPALHSRHPPGGRSDSTHRHPHRGLPPNSRDTR